MTAEAVGGVLQQPADQSATDLEHAAAAAASKLFMALIVAEVEEVAAGFRSPDEFHAAIVAAVEA